MRCINSYLPYNVNHYKYKALSPYMNQERIFTHVSTIKLLNIKSGAFMPGLLLTEPAAVKLLRMHILQPEILIPVESEHHFGQRINGVTYNIFTPSLPYGPNVPTISEILLQDGFRRLSSNLRCYEILSPNVIATLAQLATG